jgi:hypothetical protein
MFVTDKLSAYELVEEPLSRRPRAEDVGAAGVQHKLIWGFRNGNALSGSPLLLFFFFFEIWFSSSFGSTGQYLVVASLHLEADF